MACLVLHPLTFTKNLRCMDIPPYFSISAKGNNFCDILLAFLDWKALPKEDLLLTLLHSEGPKLHRVLVLLSAIGLKKRFNSKEDFALTL